MKKAITLICIILSVVVILDSFNAWHAFAMFYLAGEIPGTRTSVNPTTMLSIFALLIGFVVARLGNRLVLIVAEYLSVKHINQRV